MSAVIAWLAHRRFNYVDYLTGSATGACVAEGLYLSAAGVLIGGVFVSALVSAIITIRSRDRA